MAGAKVNRQDGENKTKTKQKTTKAEAEEVSEAEMVNYTVLE